MVQRNLRIATSGTRAKKQKTEVKLIKEKPQFVEEPSMCEKPILKEKTGGGTSGLYKSEELTKSLRDASQ